MVILADVRNLQLASTQINTVGSEALDAYVLSLRSQSNETLSKFSSKIEWLQLLTALKPYLPQKVKSLEADADALLDGIRATAHTAKLNLEAILESMRFGCGLSDDRTSLKNPELHQLFEDGHLAMPTK